jgi:hypothetical protein
VVVINERPPIGWMWGMSEGATRPALSRDVAQEHGVLPRIRKRKSWLKSMSEMAMNPQRVPTKRYLICRGCGRSKPANPYTLRPEVMARFKCTNCGSRVITLSMPKATYDDPLEHRREVQAGAWVESKAQRNLRIRRRESA